MNEARANLEAKYGKEELDALVREKIASFEGLLTREAALKLIASEAGLLQAERQEPYSVKGIPADGRGIALMAKVSRIFQKTVTGTNKLYRDMQISDSTGIITLRLWGKDTEFFSKIKVGDVVEVTNAYTRSGTLNLSFKGTVRVHEKAPFVPLAEIKDGGFVNVRGAVLGIEGERSYSKEGKSKSYFVFSLGTASQGGAPMEKRCVIWDFPDRGKKLAVGDELIIENALAKNGELHLSFSSRMLQKPKSAIFGKIEAMECIGEGTGEEAVIKVNGRELRFDRGNALRLLGVNVAKDVSLSTITTIKKSLLLNKDITLRGRVSEGRFIFD